MASTRLKGFFVAGAGVKRRVIREVIRRVVQFTATCYDWTKDDLWKPGADPTMAAMQDLQAVQESPDGVIWWLNHDPSNGAPFEVGAAFAKGYPVVILIEEGSDIRIDDMRHWIYTQIFPYAHNLHDAMVILRRAKRLPMTLPLQTIAAHRFMERLLLSVPPKVKANSPKKARP